MRRSLISLSVVFLLLAAVLLSTTAGHAASVTVRVESAQAASGKEAEIPITVQGAPGIGAMHLELTYDPAVLEAKSVDKGPLLGDNALLDFNASEPGRLVIGLVTLDGVDGDGTVLVTRFAVTGEAEQKSPLNLENVRAWEGETRLDILVTTEGGEFAVSGGGSSVLLLLAALAAVLVLLLLLVVMRRRRRQQPAPARPSPPAGVGANFCSQCGAQLEAGQPFCTNCGHRVAG